MTKSVDFSIFSKKYFFIQSYDFLSIKYSKLYKRPILNNQLIFTSYNGVKGFLYNFEYCFFRKKIYVVGEKTFFFLKKHFPYCFFFQKDYVQDIIEEIIKTKSNQYYDWFCGNKNIFNQDINFFKEKNINRYEVYKTFLIPRKIKNLSDYHGIIFFSPSGVQSFFLNNKIENNTKTEIFAIGKTTAKFISNFLHKKIWIPKKPSLKEVFTLVKNFYDVYI
ncbi:uroporphyrinogen-III synthase [Blattabacterium sp. (Blattella germanica)]|uniref:uroporphyrinogen-III synthase n=1 Tax=Blattabacterium sp. (Blattella germanica) TaxID=624186 RepID=UPI0011EA6C6C|nr:uroporphyrinogen-III synthase [Blattabacterium sp. (Blattella germanica)]